LFWRVLLYGVAMLAASAVTVGLVTRFLREPPPFFDVPARYARLLEADCRTSSDRLQAHLDELTSVLGDSLAVYTKSGRRLAAAGPFAASLELVSSDTEHSLERPLERRVDDRLVLSVPLACGEGPAYLLIAPPQRHPHGPFLWPTLLISFAFLLLAVLLIARTIARPLERITTTVRSFGRGDLSARTGLQGRDEIAALAHAFDEMAERLQAMVQRERELLANVSHEIRTPLARVAVALDLCSEEDAGVEAVQQHLSGIRGDIDELNRLLEDVLTTARLDLVTEGARGALRLQRADVALADVVTQALERFERAHPEHRVLPTLPDRPLRLSADPVLLRRVLDNLLENAARYADPGAPIEIEADRHGDRVCLEVRDRGLGVDEADLPRLFEPFFRSAKARARYAGGLGLGLALCRRVIEAHGGIVEAERRAGGGLVIRVLLPGL